MQRRSRLPISYFRQAAAIHRPFMLPLALPGGAEPDEGFVRLLSVSVRISASNGRSDEDPVTTANLPQNEWRQDR
ncbi:hypothetical protein GGTG_10074 [Gaeumannomyces tritici R3-111a-1]|uniref:Uncharacterized protein n=1 Tax=Gaeumannomyces tritici (strain R3-111a-1) TaxID=644352 RepID=J3P991_GAET3|nr:hypothetical protein GGTG_10074 [Gaeumannomyces tritici R3-111a-1]EJT73227.1 hypothetical protein GGTG_10074 [Gaeumannomyces tritici R3-111a-1]